MRQTPLATSRRLLSAVAVTLLAGSVLVAAGALPAAAATTAGATLPFAMYEAEAGTLAGGATIVALTSAPTTQYSSPALEASGHAYVALTGLGQSVQWTNNTGAPISAINVRESIPDSSSGTGSTATLDLYVNGAFRQTLNLNSIQSWFYEGTNYNGSDQTPSEGDPRDFFDESHTFITGAPIAAGSTFSLVRDSGNTATFYDIDEVDVENPPPALTQPANSISITSCGAVADNNPTNGTADSGAVDDTSAIQTCINQAESQGKILWIPAGTYYLKGTTGLTAQGITIAGAGMWYSTIYRDVPLPNNTPLAALFDLTSCTVQNFHLDSDATSRAEVDGGGGAMDTSGTNWVANGIWSQHVESGFWASGTGGTVENSRLTAIWADGINLNNVSLNNTVGNNLTATNNFVRGTGDDGMAINSVNYNTDGNGNKTFYTAMSGITMTHNTIIAPWGGKGIGIYGGSSQDVEFNYISDTARYIGLGAGRFGVNGSDLTSATVNGNVVVRSGGNAYNQGQPALHIGNGGDGQNVGVVSNVTVTNNTVTNSVYDGIAFSTSTGTLLQNNTVTSPWRNGIVISPPFYPAPTGSATITGNTVTGLASGMTAYANNSSGFTASLSGNSWQSGGTTEGPYGGTAAAVPGTVQAENYDTGGQGVGYSVSSVNGSGNSYRTDGVDLEATSDTGGGYDVGWTATAQWFRYTVNVATAGTYTVSFRIAAPSAVTDAFHIANASGTNLSGNVNLTATGGWQTWATATANVTLPAGQQVLTLAEDNGGWNINSLQFAATGTGEGPYGGTAAAIPGTVQAENYDTGGQGVGYSVGSVNGTGNAYRTDGVDLEATSDTGGGYNVGWTAPGQWFRYTVNVATAGTYAVSFRTAGPNAVTDAFHLANASGTNLSGNVTVTGTGGYQTWATVTANVTLPAGQQVLTLDEDNANWNLNYMQFASSGGGTASLTASPTSLTYASQNVGTTSAAQAVTIHNTGTAAASVTSVGTSGDFAQTNTCGTSIAAGASCTVNVTFTPSASGTRTGTLTVNSSATNSPTTVSLTGTGAAGAVNLAAGKATSESSHTDVYPSSNVTDGNQSTYWESANNAFPQWVQVDLGSAQSVQRIVLQLPASWGARSQTLVVAGSTDGTNFTTIVNSASYTFDPNSNNTVTITFTGTTQRYWRVTISANNGWPAGQISEFQIWNS